uniref:Uncharacterized protein n=1 Tax=Romanomermis culicivorax TaxID=13658 RepID=A0A915I1P0_ROMCU
MPHTATRHSPFSLLRGYKPHITFDYDCAHRLTLLLNYDAYHYILTQAQLKMHEKVKANLDLAPALFTTPKVLKKKKEKQKEGWNKSPDISDHEDLALQPRSLFDDPKHLQAAVTSAMKSGLMDCLIELLNFPVSPLYKLAIQDRLQYKTDPALPLIPHEVDDLWIDRVTADQPLRD